MTDMPDGNSAALREYEQAQDRRQEAWDAYEGAAREHVQDKLLSGQCVRSVGRDLYLSDLIHDYTLDDALVANVVIRRPDAVDELTKAAARLIDEWIATDNGQDCLSAIIDSLDEDKRSGI